MPGRAIQVRTAISGFLVGIVLIGCAGVIPYMNYMLGPNDIPLRVRWAAGAISAVIVIGGLAGLFRLLRARPLRGPASFLVGLLLGLGAAALLEGICFGFGAQP